MDRTWYCGWISRQPNSWEEVVWAPSWLECWQKLDLEPVARLPGIRRIVLQFNEVPH